MVVIEHGFGFSNVLLDLALLAPGQREDPVEVVAHDCRLSRHRRHLAKLAQLGHGLVVGFLRQFCLLDAILDLAELVALLLAFAEFLLDRLELLVEVVLALCLFHLALHARADLALDLEHAHLGFHEAEDLFKPLAHVDHLEKTLLLGNLHGQVGRDRIRQL